MSDFQTNEQKMAQTAFARVNERKAQGNFDKYKSFALSFPTLIHSCGIVQAIAFASKDRKDFVDDLEAVFHAVDEKTDLQKRSREAGIMEYMKISRQALSAATWIKRYCQAL